MKHPDTISKFAAFLKFFVPAASAISFYLRLSVFAFAFLVILAPFSGLTPAALGLPATSIFLSFAKKLRYRLFLILAIGSLYMAQYLESVYNLPVEYILSSFSGFQEILKVVVVPVCAVIAASLCSSWLARKVRIYPILARLYRGR